MGKEWDKEWDKEWVKNGVQKKSWFIN